MANVPHIHFYLPKERDLGVNVFEVMSKVIPKAIPVAMFIAGWVSHATKDGEITDDEAIELVKGIITALELDLRIKVGRPQA